MPYRKVKGRRPKHQKQLGRSPTGSYDCGPRSWQMGIDVQTGGKKRPGPRKLRKLAGREGNVTTRAEDARRAISSLPKPKGFKEPLRYRVKLQRPWAEAEKALRNRRAVHIAIDYGDVNRNKPQYSSQKTFNGGHSILLFGIRRKKKRGARGWEIGVNDPLAGRRRWWPLGLVRHAAGKIAGKPGHFYGGIFIPGVRDLQATGPADAGGTVEETEIKKEAGQQPAPGEKVTKPGKEFKDDHDDDIDDDESGITDGNLKDPQYPEDDPDPSEMGTLKGNVDPS